MTLAPPMTSLEKDLTYKLRERLAQACKDHIELCEAADIPARTAAATTIAMLGALMTSTAAEFLPQMTPEQWGEAHKSALELARKAKTNEQQR